MAATLEDLVAAARAASEPCRTAPSTIKPGGVDPLGLRAINFDLMDKVFPGVNNVANRIRPFTVVTWAWRRAARLANAAGYAEAPAELLLDFVDRIEVLFAWSQLSRNRSSGLPGSDLLTQFQKEGEYTFGGERWEAFRKARRYSTGLSSPINYGPSLRSLGWLIPDSRNSGALSPGPGAVEALDALEARLAPHLHADAFASLDAVTVTQGDVLHWADAWALDDLTKEEQALMAELLAGANATVARRKGVGFLIEATGGVDATNDVALRRALAGPIFSNGLSEEAADAAAAWRDLQVRQLFRLALEGLFAWCVATLEGPMPTHLLVERFLQPADQGFPTGRQWLAANPASDLVSLIEELQACIRAKKRDEFPGLFRQALALCLHEAPEKPADARLDRLPLASAAREMRSRIDDTPSAIMTHVIEAWCFGQHVYWSVGRGLADARQGQRMLLRLRIVLEEGGWARSPGAQPGVPNATPDRLATVVSLARESGILPTPTSAP